MRAFSTGVQFFVIGVCVFASIVMLIISIPIGLLASCFFAFVAWVEVQVINVHLECVDRRAALVIARDQLAAEIELYDYWAKGTRDDAISARQRYRELFNKDSSIEDVAVYQRALKKGRDALEAADLILLMDINKQYSRVVANDLRVAYENCVSTKRALWRTRTPALTAVGAPVESD